MAWWIASESSYRILSLKSKLCTNTNTTPQKPIQLWAWSALIWLKLALTILFAWSVCLWDLFYAVKYNKITCCEVIFSFGLGDDSYTSWDMIVLSKKSAYKLFGKEKKEYFTIFVSSFPNKV